MTLVERLQQLIGNSPSYQRGEGPHPDEVSDADSCEIAVVSYICALPAFFDVSLLAYLTGKDRRTAAQWLAQIAAMPSAMPRWAESSVVGLQYHKATRARWLDWWRAPAHQSGYVAIARRLASYYLPIADAFRRQLTGGTQAEAIQRFNTIYPNLEAALLHTQATGQWSLVRRLVYAVAPYQAGVGLWEDQACWAQAGMKACVQLQDPAGVADMHLLLGNALCHTPPDGDGDPVALAIHHYKTALKLGAAEKAPHIQAMTDLNLGNAYTDLQIGERAANLQQAMQHYRAALQAWSPEGAPAAYTLATNNIGVVYLQLGETGHTGQLRKAIAYFEEALRVHQAAPASLDYAMIRNNLGTAFLGLAQAGEPGATEKAKDHLEAALAVWTPSLAPRWYAIALSNLGIAYSLLQTANVTQHLLDAIACHEEALRYLDPDRDPLQFAKTQSNLGVAYGRCPTGDPEENLRRAIACYRAALSVAALPKWNRARFHQNLLDAYQTRSTVAGILRRRLRRRPGTPSTAHAATDAPGAPILTLEAPPKPSGHAAS